MFRRIQKLLVLSLTLLISFTFTACKSSQLRTNKRTTKVAQKQHNGASNSSNAFGISLYKELVKDPKNQGKNVFFSPYSLTTALTMTLAGAKGETAKEMEKTLHITDAKDLRHQSAHALHKQLQAQGKGGYYVLHTVNRLWGQKNFTFQNTFQELLKKQYEADLEKVDFTGQSEASRNKINKWVEEQTHDKIKDLLPKGIIKPNTKLVLTNAIYFKGTWGTQFKPSDTKEGIFRVSPTQTIKHPMMHQKAEHKYMENKDLQLLMMSYRGLDLSMIVLLPKKEKKLSQLESTLSVTMLNQWIAKVYKQKVNVTLPKFKVHTGISLTKLLPKMGMKSAFSPKKADFSGITGKKDLYISDVVHKGFIEVNEEGTEAAAATAVVTARKSKPFVPMFKADRPFIYLIRDNFTGTILFLGRLNQPKG